MKMLERADFCPMGKKCNTRMLPHTFVKVCLDYQRRASLRSSHGMHGEAHSLIHSHACFVCPVGPHIRKGKDPVEFVSDVEWFTIEEIATIQGAISKVSDSLKKAIKKIKKTTFARKDVARMKARLNKMKSLLHQVGDILDSILEDEAQKEMQLNASAKTAQKKEPIAIVQAEVKKESTPAAPKPVKKATTPPLETGKAVYDMVQKGMSRDAIAAELGLTKKYLSKLMSNYKKTIAI